MSPKEYIEQLSSAEEAANLETASAFRDLARQIGDGDEPDTNEVARILKDAGKTIDDLQAAIELYERRKSLRKRLDDAGKIDRLAGGQQRIVA